jgi:2-isopropylmalate synthase
MIVQRNKAIVGRNAFAHEAGIHQDGMLKEPSTYEIMRPEDVGFVKTDLVLGKHSGRAALADRAKALGYHLTPEQLDAVFAEFKKLADKKKEIYDGDIAALIEERNTKIEDQWQFVAYRVEAATGQPPVGTLTLTRSGEERKATVSEGDGPLDALFRAIEDITDVHAVLRDYRVQAATSGKDAQGETLVELDHNGRTYRGRGVSTDTVEAGVEAYLNAVNRIILTAGHPPSEKPTAV